MQSSRTVPLCTPFHFGPASVVELPPPCQRRVELLLCTASRTLATVQRSCSHQRGISPIPRPCVDALFRPRRDRPPIIAVAIGFTSLASACFRLLRQLLLSASASASLHLWPSTICSCILLPAALSLSPFRSPLPRLALHHAASPRTALHRTTSLDRYRRCCRRPRRCSNRSTFAFAFHHHTDSLWQALRQSFPRSTSTTRRRFTCSLPFHARLAIDSA